MLGIPKQLLIMIAWVLDAFHVGLDNITSLKYLKNFIISAPIFQLLLLGEDWIF